MALIFGASVSCIILAKLIEVWVRSLAGSRQDQDPLHGAGHDTHGHDLSDCRLYITPCRVLLYYRRNIFLFVFKNIAYPIKKFPGNFDNSCFL